MYICHVVRHVIRFIYDMQITEWRKVFDAEILIEFLHFGYVFMPFYLGSVPITILLRINYMQWNEANKLLVNGLAIPSRESVSRWWEGDGQSAECLIINWQYYPISISREFNGSINDVNRTSRASPIRFASIVNEITARKIDFHNLNGES